MPFPRFTNQTDRDGLSFLAICSMRRLLNRIHRAIYANHPGGAQISTENPVQTPGWRLPHPPNNLFTVGSLGTVSAELARQLDGWYNSLPDVIKPDLAETCPRDMHDGWLRLRYWSARHIICRPCLVYVVASSNEDAEFPAYVMDYSEACIDSCRRYIQIAAYVLMERTQYTWMTIQAWVKNQSS